MAALHATTDYRAVETLSAANRVVVPWRACNCVSWSGSARA